MKKVPKINKLSRIIANQLIKDKKEKEMSPRKPRVEERLIQKGIETEIKLDKKRIRNAIETLQMSQNPKLINSKFNKMIADKAVNYYFDIEDRQKMAALTKSKSVQHMPRAKMSQKKINQFYSR